MASTISCASSSDDLSPSIHRMLRLAYLIAMSGGWALRVYDERQFAQTPRSRVARPLDNWAGARDQPDDPDRHDRLGGPPGGVSPHQPSGESRASVLQAFLRA